MLISEAGQAQTLGAMHLPPTSSQVAASHSAWSQLGPDQPSEQPKGQAPVRELQTAWAAQLPQTALQEGPQRWAGQEWTGASSEARVEPATRAKIPKEGKSFILVEMDNTWLLQSLSGWASG